MFTGLIQCMGEILSVRRSGQENRLKIRPYAELTRIELGESIAVNGVCLTVERFAPGWFEAFASGETLSRTTLGNLTTGSRVNLERALAMGDRLGGHMVTGHVDCLAGVEAIRESGESRRFSLGFPEEYARLVVPKGSVALDGISLTVNTCTSDHLEVNIIPATLGETTISKWKPGTTVNMETDIIGKYVQRMLSAWEQKKDSRNQTGFGLDFLRKHGF